MVLGLLLLSSQHLHLGIRNPDEIHVALSNSMAQLQASHDQPPASDADADGDGVVSNEELEDYLKKKDNCNPAEPAHKVIRKADKDGDVARELEKSKSVNLDSDGDGVVSEEEVEKTLEANGIEDAKKVAGEIVDKFDSNDDNILEGPEIKQAEKAIAELEDKEEEGDSESVSFDFPEDTKELDTDKNGKVSKEELAEGLKKTGNLKADLDGDGKVSDKEAAEKAASIVDQADTDGDGQLDEEEIAKARGEQESDSEGESTSFDFGAADTNKDGKITEEELAKALEKDGELADTDGDGAVSKKEAEAAAERIFKEADKDKSGGLDQKEFGEAMKAPNKGEADDDKGDESEEFSGEFEDVDADKDGDVDEAELAKAFQETNAKVADADGNGKVSKEEAEKAAADIMKEADTDGSGNLDKKEFEKAMEADDESEEFSSDFGDMDGNGDKKVDEAELAKELEKKDATVADADGNGDVTPEEAQKAAAKMIKKADTDGSGDLDKDELKEAMKAKAEEENESSEDFESTDFDAVDTDDDNKLNEKEISEALQKNRMADADGDGVTTKEEADKAAKEMMKKADKDNSGDLSKEEFSEAIKGTKEEEEKDDANEDSSEEFDSQNFEETADKNKDGVTSQEELQEALQTANAADANHDGKTTEKEAEDAAAKLMLQADADGNGNLNKEELKTVTEEIKKEAAEAKEEDGEENDGEEAQPHPIAERQVATMGDEDDKDDDEDDDEEELMAAQNAVDEEEPMAAQNAIDEAPGPAAATGLKVWDINRDWDACKCVFCANLMENTELKTIVDAGECAVGDAKATMAVLPENFGKGTLKNKNGTSDYDLTKGNYQCNCATKKVVKPAKAPCQHRIAVLSYLWSFFVSPWCGWDVMDPANAKTTFEKYVGAGEEERKGMLAETAKPDGIGWRDDLCEVLEAETLKKYIDKVPKKLTESLKDPSAAKVDTKKIDPYDYAWDVNFLLDGFKARGCAEKIRDEASMPVPADLLPSKDAPKKPEAPKEKPTTPEEKKKAAEDLKKANEEFALEKQMFDNTEKEKKERKASIDASIKKAKASAKALVQSLPYYPYVKDQFVAEALKTVLDIEDAADPMASCGLLEVHELPKFTNARYAMYEMDLKKAQETREQSKTGFVENRRLVFMTLIEKLDKCVTMSQAALEQETAKINEAKAQLPLMQGIPGLAPEVLAEIKKAANAKLSPQAQFVDHLRKKNMATVIDSVYMEPEAANLMQTLLMNGDDADKKKACTSILEKVGDDSDLGHLRKLKQKDEGRYAGNLEVLEQAFQQNNCVKKEVKAAPKAK
eukprot:TRINITY_DN13968_c0_g1_i2.p1 TRINITY_DN13968_c0_g1~~TRINITY_DN13968_c0_g1_i2.p1  ORF type:complete len:1338 (-),score=459.84 TRINITY_DN13968_c0_g1_i2:215-4138(-)